MTDFEMKALKKAIENVITIKDLAFKIYYANNSKADNKGYIAETLKDEFGIEVAELYMPPLELEKPLSLAEFIGFSVLYIDSVPYKKQLLEVDEELFTSCFYNEIPLFEATPWAFLLDDFCNGYAGKPENHTIADGSYEVEIYDLNGFFSVYFPTQEKAEQFIGLIGMPGTLNFVKKQDSGTFEIAEIDCF